MNADVVIVGGGLAGLSCALELLRRGVSAQIIEAGDAVGGRVRTDVVNGFRLDRGFQVLLTAYPSARELLNNDELQLQSFTPGALVRRNGKFERVTDPRRRPWQMISTARAKIGSIRDKLETATMGLPLLSRPVASIFRDDESSTLTYLRSLKLSDSMVDGFFRPFYGGIFLERELRTSSRMFKFTFKMFATGDTSVPARGMGAIPEQMASRLPKESIRLNARVQQIDGTEVTLSTGEQISCRGVVIANAAMKIHGKHAVSSGNGHWRGTTTMYFAAERSPVGEPILVLNGQGYGPVNHLVVMSDVAPDYAPAGAALISVSVLGVPIQNDHELERQVNGQLVQWFGTEVNGWRMLRTYRIPHALPEQGHALGVEDQQVRMGDGLYVCGDHLGNASIEGAMASGMKAARAIAEDWADKRHVA